MPNHVVLDMVREMNALPSGVEVVQMALGNNESHLHEVVLVSRLRMSILVSP